MGLIYAEIELISTDDLGLANRGYISGDMVKRQIVNALVDTGSYTLSINEHIMKQLDLRVLDTHEVELADGTLQMVDIVGPIDIRFKNRSTTCRAVVFPKDTEVLLGAIPMEDMDVLIDPKQEQLIVNPANPYIARKSMK